MQCLFMGVPCDFTHLINTTACPPTSGRTFTGTGNQAERKVEEGEPTDISSKIGEYPPNLQNDGQNPGYAHGFDPFSKWLVAHQFVHQKTQVLEVTSFS